MVTVSLMRILPLLTAMGLAFPFAMCFDPKRMQGKLLTCSVAGLFMLLAWNTLLPPLRLGINPLSVLTTGSLGLPGMALLACLSLTP